MSDHPHPTAPASTPILVKALAYGGLSAALIAVVGAVVGGVVAGMPGVVGALIGTAMAVVFLGVTAASILVANRFFGSDLYVGVFFAIVLGSWLVKFVVFIILALLLKDQAWLDPIVLFVCLVAGVVSSLVVDVVVIVRNRIPYVSDRPEDSSGPSR